LLVLDRGRLNPYVANCEVARREQQRKLSHIGANIHTKAADEMLSRVKAFAPAAAERATIGTFHSFCAQVLRQHGVHIGIRPDFAVYGLDADRRLILEDAVRRGQREGKSVSEEDLRFLPMIDRLKGRLVDPTDVKTGKVKIADANALAEVYQLYEEELRQANALDFGSMIFETYRLFSSFPAIAKRYQSSHPSGSSMSFRIQTTRSIDW